jgi:hypothetical protein
MADDHTGDQDKLDVAQAEAEVVIQPYRVLDDRSREAEAAVGIGRGRHIEQAATLVTDRQLDNAFRPESGCGNTNWALTSSGQLRLPLLQAPGAVNLAMPLCANAPAYAPGMLRRAHRGEAPCAMNGYPTP